MEVIKGNGINLKPYYFKDNYGNQIIVEATNETAAQSVIRQHTNNFRENGGYYELKGEIK